jgi:methyl-accepting chemotaxis protein
MNVRMTGLLRNARIRTKLLAIVLVPMLGLGYLALSRVFDRNDHVRSATVLRNVARISTAIGSLLHETQKERGMSSGFLSSKGQKFAGVLDEQRTRVDKQLAELRDLAGSEGQGLPEVVRARIGDALGSLDQLPTIRARVKAFSIEVQEEIAFFTGANTKLLDSLGAVAAVTPDADLGRLATGYLAFLTAKEKTGIERAQLTNVFTAGKFNDDAQYLYFSSVVSARNTYIEIFQNSTTPEIASAYSASSQEGAFVQSAAM